MKMYSLLVSLMIAIAALSATFIHAQPQLKPISQLPKSIPENTKIPSSGVNLLQPNIDLATESINFSVVKVADRFNAVVKIEGVIRNAGRLNYASGKSQQSALLYEDNGGVPRLVASQSFQNLDVNATVKVSFTRNWYKGSPAEGEFPPNYILIIDFAPTIYTDSNDNNNDAENANNRLTKSAREINSFSFKR